MTKTSLDFPIRITILKIALLTFFCLVLMGCSLFKSITNDKESKELFKSREQYVRIVKQDVVKGVKVPPNEHPVSLDGDQIRIALSSLEIMMPGENKSKSVFSKSELESLVKYVPPALAEAGAEEDVAFVVIGDYKAAYGLAKEPKFTSGRVFYRDGKLNIIFGKIQEDYKQYVDRRLYPMLPGSRSVPSQHVWMLLEQPDQSFFAANDGVRTDWVLLDLASMEARMVLGEKAAAQAGAGVSDGGAIQARFKTEKTVEERLSILNDLKSKKLINEDEYQRKRAEILKDL